MPFSIQRLPDEPILLAKYTGRMEPEDLVALRTQSVQLAGEVERVYRVNDARQLELSFSDLVAVMGAETATRTNPGSLGDPRFNDIIVVSPGSLVRFGTESLSQEQYGSLQIPLFEDLGEGLAHARAQIKQATP
jgi:hypothetical protein